MLPASAPVASLLATGRCFAKVPSVTVVDKRLEERGSLLNNQAFPHPLLDHGSRLTVNSRLFQERGAAGYMLRGIAKEQPNRTPGTNSTC